MQRLEHVRFMWFYVRRTVKEPPRTINYFSLSSGRKGTSNLKLHISGVSLRNAADATQIWSEVLAYLTQPTFSENHDAAPPSP